MSIDTKKELAKIAGVSYDTIYKGLYITEHADADSVALQLNDLHGGLGGGLGEYEGTWYATA